MPSRALVWDRLRSETGAPGASFEDHTDLTAYPYLEWSHLSAEDAPRFTADLIGEMRKEGILW